MECTVQIPILICFTQTHRYLKGIWEYKHVALLYCNKVLMNLCIWYNTGDGHMVQTLGYSRFLYSVYHQLQPPENV